MKPKMECPVCQAQNMTVKKAVNKRGDESWTGYCSNCSTRIFFTDDVALNTQGYVSGVLEDVEAEEDDEEEEEDDEGEDGEEEDDEDDDEESAGEDAGDRY